MYDKHQIAPPQADHDAAKALLIEYGCNEADIVSHRDALLCTTDVRTVCFPRRVSVGNHMFVLPVITQL